MNPIQRKRTEEAQAYRDQYANRFNSTPQPGANFDDRPYGQRLARIEKSLEELNQRISEGFALLESRFDALIEAASDE